MGKTLQASDLLGLAHSVHRRPAIAKTEFSISPKPARHSLTNGRLPMQKMVRPLFEQARHFGSKGGTPLAAVCALPAASIVSMSVSKPAFRRTMFRRPTEVAPNLTAHHAIRTKREHGKLSAPSRFGVFARHRR